MKFSRPKILYLPALSIIAAVIVMLVIISISTYRNLQRQQQTAFDFMKNQGVALLNAIEAGARSQMLIPAWEEDDIDMLIREIARQGSISHIYLFNSEYMIVHHTDFSQEDRIVSWRPELNTDSQIKTRVAEGAEGTPVLELAKRFNPLSGDTSPGYQNRLVDQSRRMMSHLHQGDTIVLGLNMQPVVNARQADRQHAIIMGLILIALGSGALFFLIVIQNYHLAKKTLEHTRDYARQVIGSMADGLLSLDARGHVVSYNAQALTMLGADEKEVAASHIGRLFDLQSTGIDATLKTCRPVIDREIRYHRKGGETSTLLISATPIAGTGGGCSGCVIVLKDLSDIKRLEDRVQRVERQAAVGRLAAGVAHEIRNPLSSIRGFASYLGHRLSDRPKEKEYAEVMVEEVDRINTVVTNLITIARPAETKPKVTDIGQLIQHTIRLVEEDAARQNAVIEVDRSQTVDKALVDSNQIIQALLNLLLNALEATPAQGRIRIGAEKCAAKERICIWVEDEGPGVPEEIRDKIFDPFFTTREEGNGLGLSIVRTIAENHGGEVVLESPPPDRVSGSRFTIRLPDANKEKETGVQTNQKPLK